MNITHYERLPDSSLLQERWNQLAGDNPFRGWQWLTTWWMHYGSAAAPSAATGREAGRTLSLWTVTDGRDASKNIIGILPCYVEHSLLRGRVLRLLGDGEVCSDHTGLLVASGRQGEAAAALARQLMDRDDLDAIDFQSIDHDDIATNQLFAELQQRGMDVSAELAPRCWSIELPADWDDYLALQSKSHRKQLRRAGRRLAQDADISWRSIENDDQLEPAWRVLTDLHQRRRQSLGEPGCFSSPRWAAFHRDVAAQFLAVGRLRLSTMTIGQTPVAAEYHFVGRETTYAYQGGVEPARLDDEPGRLSLICAIQQALAEGHTTFDLLRGDEPYKPHWRAVPQAASNLSAVPPRTFARLRDGARTGLRSARDKARRVAGIAD